MNADLAAESALTFNVHFCRMYARQRKSNAQNFLIVKADSRLPKYNLRLRLAVETCNIQSTAFCVHT
jgi:hypothetical protein